MRNVLTSRDRGQLILVGALSLAIVLVGIALVLNASIFAENLATRANQQESGEVVALEQEAVGGAGVAMEHLHHDVNSHTSYTSLENDFDTAIDEWSDLTVRDSAREGQYVDAEYTGTYTQGTRVVQDDGGTFEPKDEDAVVTVDLSSTLLSSFTVEYWAVTPGASQMRDFSMTVDHSQLGTDTGSTLSLDAAVVDDYLANIQLDADAELSLVNSVALEEAPFTVVYDVNDDNTVDHSFAIYPSEADSDDVNVTYRSHDGSGVTRTCTVEDVDSMFTVDVSNGQVEGGDGACSEVFAFQSEISNPYQLYYLQGDQIGGDYELIVDKSNSQFETDYGGLDLLDLNLFGLLTFDPTFSDIYQSHPSASSHDSTYDPDDPYIEPAIYSAEIGLDYRTDSADYESTATVAPNEP